MAKKTLLKVFCSCLASVSVSSLIIAPSIYFGLESKNIINTNVDGIVSNNIVAGPNKPSMMISNRNSDYESPNGVVQKVKDANNNITFEFNSYFNKLEWTYELIPASSTQKTLLTLQSDFNQLENVDIKYNSFSNTFFVYGNYLTSSNVKVPFLYQINATNGTEVIVNNSQANSIWVWRERQFEIEDIIAYGENSSVLIIPKYKYWGSPVATTFLFRVNFSAYTSTQLQWFSLGSTPNPIPTNKNDTIYKIGSIFDLSDSGRWGITFLDVSDTTKTKYKYLIFDNDLNLLAFSNIWQEILINNTSNQQTGKIYNEISFADPLVFKSKTSEKYTIVDANVTPFFDTNFQTDKKAAIGSDEIRFATFTVTPSVTATPVNITHSPTKISLIFSNIQYYVYQFKKDTKNNLLYFTLYQKDTTSSSTTPLINLQNINTFIYSIDPDATTPSLTVNSNFLTYNYTNQKAVMNLSVINDYSEYNDVNPVNATEKSHVVKEISIYTPTQNVFNENPNIVQWKRNSSNKTVTNGVTKFTWGTDIEWGKFVQTDYSTLITNDIKNKLPGDVAEDQILSWINFKNNSVNIDYLGSNSLEIMNATSGYSLSASKKVLYNNETGNLKARVKSDINKWWYQKPTTNALEGYEKNVIYTDIEVAGFATIDVLMFQLVTNSQIDATKWDNITNKYFGKKLPSDVTHQEIIEDFIIKGSKIILTANDINIVDNEANINNQKVINVIKNDTNGTLRIKYDLNSKSSPGVPINYLVGDYTFTGFLSTSSFTQITIDTAKFNNLKKTKLAYAFTIDDLLKVVNYSNGYSSNPNDWTLQYTDLTNTTQFNENLINGNTSFTLTHKRLSNIPSSINDSFLKVTVNASNNGSGCKKLEDYIGGAFVSNPIEANYKLSGLFFDEKYANSLTGTDTEENVDNNIRNLLMQTLTVDQNWFDVSQFTPVKNKTLSVENKAVYDLTLKNDITSNITITKDGKKNENLILTKALQDKLKAKRPNMLKINFQDKLQVTFNYSSVKYDWNYDIKSEVGSNSTSISFDSLIEKVNNDRTLNNQSLLPSNYRSASEFVSKYKDKIDLFHSDFQLIVSQSVNLSSVDKNDPSYFEITSIDMIPNDQNGTVLVKYKLFYPNLTSSIQVVTSPEIMITGFPSSSVATTILIVVVVAIVILLIALIIWLSIYLNTKRHKSLHQNKNKLYKSSFFEIYKKKVVKK